MRVRVHLRAPAHVKAGKRDTRAKRHGLKLVANLSRAKKLETFDSTVRKQVRVAARLGRG